jgi:hypothetical protein
MQQRLPFLARHVVIRIAQHEANSSEKVGLAATIPADNHVGFWTEGFNHSLFLV